MSGGGGVTKAVGNAVGSAAGSLGGAGKVIGPAVQLGTGSSPLGVFGTALGSEVAGSMFGGGSGGGAAGSGGDNRFGMGRNMLNQNVPMGGPFGVNMAAPAYNIMMNQQRPQPQPLVQQPQVGARLFNGVVTPDTIGPNGLPVGGMPQNDTYFPVGLPQKPGLPQIPQPQVLPRAPSAPTPFNSTPVRPQILPQNTPMGGPMAGGLAGLANAIRGRR